MIVDRPYEGERDLQRATDLLLGSRALAGKDRAPTAKRLALLVTSRLWEPQQDAHVWEIGERMCAFALLWRRELANPVLILELLTAPDSPDFAGRVEDLTGSILAWALTRAQALAAGLGVQVSLSAATFADQAHLETLLHRAGFVLQDGHNVYLTCALNGDVPQPTVPEGYVIRTLAGESELDKYAALYSFTPMSASHRRELLHSPNYTHLVVVNPKGEFVSFCECSIDWEEWSLDAHRAGWVEYLGTQEDLQGRGLGRAVVCAGLQWLRLQGAQTAALITMETNVAAQSLYTSLGFALSERDYIYTRRLTP
jgi:ribosomal protein S18 acetylase RimI-like enzyme